MSAGAGQRENELPLVANVHQQPVRLDMQLPHTLQVALERMVLVACRKLLSRLQQEDNLVQFSNIFFLSHDTFQILYKGIGQDNLVFHAPYSGSGSAA